jgi:hypothetical protein
MTETETSRRSTAAGRGRRADEARTTDHGDTGTDLGADTTVTPDESPALTLSLTQEHALEVLLEEAKQQITEQVRERTSGSDGAAMVTAARTQLLTQVQLAQQEQARRRLQLAGAQGELALASAVQGAATIVRSVVPTALLRPDATIDAGFDLADQGLILLRRLSREVFGAVRTTLAPAGGLLAA